MRHRAVVEIFVGEELTADKILEIVDAVYNRVPAGERLRYIGGEDDGAYEVMTERADTLRPLSGSVLEVRRGRSGWKVTVIGEWVS